MNVKVIFKDGRMFEYKETAIFDDSEPGWAVLSYGRLVGNRTNLQGQLQSHYAFDESDHIVFSWNDVEKLEVTV